MKKYKIKIRKLYFYNKKIKVLYEVYVKESKNSNYISCGCGAGVSLRDFISYWFNYKFKSKDTIKF